MTTKNKDTKSTKKSRTSTKADNDKKEKKPLLSTKRKVGIAVYFTFLATLALTFGAQIWMMDVFNPPATQDPSNANQSTEAPMTSDTPATQEQSEVVTYQEEAPTPVQENLDENFQDYQFETPDNQIYPNIVLQ